MNRWLETDIQKTSRSIINILNESAAGMVKKEINKDKPEEAPKNKKVALEKRVTKAAIKGKKPESKNAKMPKKIAKKVVKEELEPETGKSIEDQIADLQDYLNNTPEIAEDEKEAIQAEIDDLISQLGEDEMKDSNLKEDDAETATFEIDYADDDVDLSTEESVIEDVRNWLGTLANEVKIEVPELSGPAGGWPIVRLTGNKEKIAKFLLDNYNSGGEETLDDVYDLYLQENKLQEDNLKLPSEEHPEETKKFINDYQDKKYYQLTKIGLEENKETKPAKNITGAIAKKESMKEVSNSKIPSYDDYENALSSRFKHRYNISTSDDGMGDLDIWNGGSPAGHIYRTDDNKYEVNLKRRVKTQVVDTWQDAVKLLNDSVLNKKNTNNTLEEDVESNAEFKVGDIVKVPYKYGSYTPGEFTEAPIIDISEGRYVTVEIPSKLEVTMDQLRKWNTLEESDNEPKTVKEYRIMDGNKVLKTFSADERSKGYAEMRAMGKALRDAGKEDNLIYKEFTVKNKLKESYSDKLGGDPSDFVSDVETIKAKLSEIDTSGFGSHLAVQMVEDWIETCDYQIEKAKRLASGDEFYTEADNRTYKDRDEAEYYRNKELYANSNLARHREAMEKAKKACEEKGIKLDEDNYLSRTRKQEPLDLVAYEPEITSIDEVKDKYVKIRGDFHKVIDVKPEGDKFVISFAAGTGTSIGGEFEPATLDEIKRLQLYTENK